MSKRIVPRGWAYTEGAAPVHVDDDEDKKSDPIVPVIEEPDRFESLSSKDDTEEVTQNLQKQAIVTEPIIPIEEQKKIEMDEKQWRKKEDAEAQWADEKYRRKIQRLEFSGFERNIISFWDGMKCNARSMEEFENYVDFYFQNHARKQKTQPDYLYYYEYEGNYIDYVQKLIERYSHDDAFAYVKNTYNAISIKKHEIDPKLTAKFEITVKELGNRIKTRMEQGYKYIDALQFALKNQHKPIKNAACRTRVPKK